MTDFFAGVNPEAVELNLIFSPNADPGPSHHIEPNPENP